MTSTEGRRARAWRIAGTIRPARLAESRCRFHGAGVTIVYNGGMNMKAKTNAERQRRYMEKLRSRAEVTEEWFSLCTASGHDSKASADSRLR
jgi:hypothetical protein